MVLLIFNYTVYLKVVWQFLPYVLTLGKRQIAIRTDSKYMIDSITKWILNWLANGWFKRNGEPVVHKEQYRQMLLAMEDMFIKWVWNQWSNYSLCNSV